MREEKADEGAGGHLAIPTMRESGPVGAGAGRAVAFGGGGVWFVAWMLGLAAGLHRGGVDLREADSTIGTSAGAIVGAAVKGGRVRHMAEAFEALSGEHTTLGAGARTPSQRRARDLMASTETITQASLQAIGRAAMAAHNPPVADHKELLSHLLGDLEWPTGHHTTATDCYTGESVIVDRDCGVGIADAGSASSSLPGLIGPTWLGDRLCMDGGVSRSSTHASMLAGAGFVLIIGMFDFSTHPPAHVNPSFGIAERVNPGTADREAAALRASGSTVHVCIANPDPGIDFMDPGGIEGAFQDGRERGLTEAAALKPNWE